MEQFAVSAQMLEDLFARRDEGYGDFICKLTPGLDRSKVIGVRMPQLRQLAKSYASMPIEALAPFLDDLPHQYYEQNIMHGLLISAQKDYDFTLRLLERYLPFVSNWAECDLLSPRSFKLKVNRERLLSDIPRWMESPLPYIKRFGILQLMNHFLDADFDPAQLQWVADERMDHYYVRMGVAWYFATALAKQWDAALAIIESRTLEKWTHNKSIQKAIESYRVSPEHKEVLRSLRQ